MHLFLVAQQCSSQIGSCCVLGNICMHTYNTVTHTCPLVCCLLWTLCPVLGIRACRNK